MFKNVLNTNKIKFNTRRKQKNYIQLISHKNHGKRLAYTL